MDLNVLLSTSSGMNNYNDEFNAPELNVCPREYSLAALGLGIVAGDTEFDAWSELWTLVRQLALNAGFQLTVRGNGKHKTWLCKASSTCPFHVRASKSKLGRIRITSVVLEHTHYFYATSLDLKSCHVHPLENDTLCLDLDPLQEDILSLDPMLSLAPDATSCYDSVEMIPTGSRNRTLTAPMATQAVVKYVQDHPTIVEDGDIVSCLTVKKALLAAFGVEAKTTFVSKVKALVAEKLMGTVAEGYTKLGSYLNQLCRDNPGSYSCFQCNPDGTFRRCIFVPGCFNDVVTLCKPFIALDACHMKGPYNKSGVYMTASMKDGANMNLLIALAIVPSENEENWKWFLQELKTCQIKIPSKFLFLSDRDKGLINAVKFAFPAAHHRYCMWHVFMNIRALKVTISSEDKAAIYRCADAPTRETHEEAMCELRAMNLRAWTYLVNLKPGVQNWCQYAIVEAGYATFGEKTSNAAEQNNAWLGILLRSSDPVTAYYIYMTKLLATFKKRRSFVANSISVQLIDAVMKSVQKTATKAKALVATELTSRRNDAACFGKYLVKNGEQSQWSARHVHIVDVMNQTCSCFQWQNNFIPCKHAMATRKECRFPKFYFNRALMALYHSLVFPSLPRDLTADTDVRIPAIMSQKNNKRGRPKKRRFKSRGE